MDKARFLSRVDELLALAAAAQESSRNNQHGHADSRLMQRFFSAGTSFLHTLLGERHVISRRFEKLGRETYELKYGIGMLETVREEIDKGWIDSLAGLVSGEVFSDFLEMAQHLWDAGYKDAAAVIAGSSLEAHLKRLATTAGIPLEESDNKGGIRHRSADLLNSELVKAGVYSKTEQKHITAWLGVRNDAAHGNYENVIKGVVGNMIDGVRLFISRYPA